MSFAEYFDYGTLDGWSLDADRLMRIRPDYLKMERFLERVRQGTVPTTSDAAFSSRHHCCPAYTNDCSWTNRSSSHRAFYAWTCWMTQCIRRCSTETFGGYAHGYYTAVPCRDRC